jgi:thioesterase domain-containing protein/acyl carrier protein
MAQQKIQFDEQPRRELEAKLTRLWREVFGLSEIGRSQDFFLLGGDSVIGERLIAKIKATFDVEFDYSTLYDARTIDKMADLIQLKQGSIENSSIVPIRTGGTGIPLFMIHGVGGNVLGFYSLVRRLSANQPVYGIQAQGLQTNTPALVRLEDLAAHYIQEMRRVQPNGPYNFLGFSFGGLVAYEMAQQLLAAGEIIGMLGLLDTWQSSYLRRTPNPGPIWLRIYYRLRIVWLNTQRLSLRNKLSYLRSRLRSRWLRLAYHRAHRQQSKSVAPSAASVRDINLIAGQRYKVRPLSGKVTLFRANEASDWNLPEDLGWREYATGGVDIHLIPGDHGQIFAEPNVSVLAEAVTRCLSSLVEEIEIA